MTDQKSSAEFKILNEKIQRLELDKAKGEERAWVLEQLDRSTEECNDKAAQADERLDRLERWKSRQEGRESERHSGELPVIAPPVGPPPPLGLPLDAASLYAMLGRVSPSVAVLLVIAYLWARHQGIIQ